jgi:hypothetical protein
MQLENGTYTARPLPPGDGAASIYESQGGALMLALKFAITDGPTLTARVCLVNKDGAVNTNNLARLREWSGWDGADPYWFMETDLSGVDVELVIENEEYQGKVSPSVKWINKPGTGGGAKLPDAADKRAILAKYGNFFRALAGGTKPAPKPAAPPSTPPARPSAPPARTAPSAPPPKAHTQATAWAVMSEKAEAAGMKQEQIEARWYEFVDATGMNQAAMTPEGWAQIEKAILDAAADGTLSMPF